MTKSFQMLSKQTASCLCADIKIYINKRRTPPKVGTLHKEIDRVSNSTHVSVREGYRAGLSRVRTVQDLKDHLADYVRLKGKRLEANAFLVFSENNRTMHGSAVI